MAENVYTQGPTRSRTLLIFFGVAAVVFVLTFLSVVLVTFLQPEAYASLAYLKVEPDISANKTNRQAATSYNSYFVQMEMKVMQSNVILEKVVEKLNLNREWGKKYAGGESLKLAESMTLLKGRMDVRETDPKSLVELRVYSDDPKESATLANAVAEVYQNYRQENIRDLELKQDLATQENKVREAQTLLESLRKSLNLSERDAQSSVPLPTLDTNAVRQLQGELISSETMLAKEKIQMAKLKELKPEQRPNAILTIVGEDSGLSSALRELRQAEQKVIVLQSEVAGEHPSLISARAVVAQGSKQVDASVEGMMTGLSNRIAGGEAAVSAINQKLEAARKSDAGKVERTRPYYEAKARLEELQGVQKLLQEKLASGQMGSELPKAARVEIVDRATPGRRPARPDKSRNLLYGAGGGLILGLLIGSLAAWLFSSRRAAT